MSDCGRKVEKVEKVEKAASKKMSKQGDIELQGKWWRPTAWD